MSYPACAGFLPLLLVAPAMAGDPPSRVEAELTHKAYSKWSIVTPAVSWKKLGGQIAIPHAANGGFLAFPGKGGIVLMVDANHDGKAETKIKGLGGAATLRGRTEQGEALTYGIRFRKKGKSWEYAASGVMAGKIHGTTIRLIDLNNNGSYADFGADGLLVGKGSSAGYLSKVVNLGGELHQLEVAPDGTNIATTPYEGETGTLDIRGGFASKGKLACAVVARAGGDVSFNIIQAKAGLTVPVGNYRLAGGCAVKGKERAQIGPGRMPAIEVAAGQTATLQWGGPLEAEFTWRRVGDEVNIPPKVSYYGRAGEEYYGFDPDTKSPKLMVFDSRKKRPVASGRFGMC